MAYSACPLFAAAEYDPIVNPLAVYSHELTTDTLAKLQKRYSVILSSGTIGTSFEGREIQAVKLGRGNHKILICGTLHAREHICTNYLMYFIEQYAEAFVSRDSIGCYDVNQLLNEVSLYIVPLVNPDGVNIVQNGFEESTNC